MFLCHFPSPILEVQSSGPGRYTAPCPVEPGLSSPPMNRGGGHPVNVALSQNDSSISPKEGQAEERRRIKATGSALV